MVEGRGLGEGLEGEGKQESGEEAAVHGVRIIEGRDGGLAGIELALDCGIRLLYTNFLKSRGMVGALTYPFPFIQGEDWRN